LAPLVLLLLAIVGFRFRKDPSGTWEKITEQMSYFLDNSAIEVVQNIAQTASHPNKSALATTIGVLLALFGASGVFGQLQDALNTIWGVKAKPGNSIGTFLRARFFSFAMVAGVCFLLLVSLVLGSGTAASAYGAASSLITLLLWIYYSSQILLFGAEFTQVYAARAGRAFVPDKYAVRV